MASRRHHGHHTWRLSPPLLLLLACVCQGAADEDARSPRITEHPVSQVVRRKDPATLRCRAEGTPSPSVVWTKDGELLAAGGGNRLTLPDGNLFFLSVEASDAGVYRCIASNEAGQAVSKNATLEDAYLRHEFRAVPERQLVTTGDSLVLQCGPPRGRPEPVVVWRKDGRRLDLEDKRTRLRLVDATNLAIRDARPSDSGRYQCVASNMAATRESPVAVVEVGVPPRLVRRPPDATALLGSSVVLRCEVDPEADPEPEVFWRRGRGANGSLEALMGRASVLPDRSLRITGVRLADAGQYECEADNRAGSVTATLTLTVVSEPTLSVSPPRVLRLEAGATATLRCAAAGVPAPLVTWALRGNRTALLPGQRLGRLSVSRELGRERPGQAAVLTLEAVTRADSGRVLVCAAVNAAGAAVSRTRLLVLPGEQWPPPVIEAGPANQTLAAHATAVLPCRTAHARRPPAATSIAWHKDGQLLAAPGPAPSSSSAPRIHVDDAGSLRIHDLQEGDAGEYACVATSRSGRYRWRGWLRVAPVGGAQHRAPEGASLPGPPGQLRANGSDRAVVLSWQRSTKVGSSTVLGYQLEVLARPQNKPDGATAAPASAPADLPSWSTLTRVPASATSYTFVPSSDEDAFVFLVRAYNSHGLSPPSDIVGPVLRDDEGRWTARGEASGAGALPEEDADVQDALDHAPVLRLTEVVVASPTSVKVLWDVLDPDQMEGLSIYWWSEADSPPSTEASGEGEAAALQSLTVQTQAGGPGLGFLVTGLRSFTVYHFFLVPFNGQGEGRPSNSARVRTLPGPPSAPPTRLEATLINGSTALVKWAPPPARHHNGPLLSYQVVVQAGAAGTELVSNVTLSEDSALQLLLSNLSSAYHVSVAAATAAGLGPFSAPLVVRPAAPLGQHHRDGAADAAADRDGGQLLTETWFMALLGSMVAVMVLLFSAIIFLHRRQHRANKETFLGFYDCGSGGPVLTTPLTLKASEGMPHPLSAPLSPPLCLVPQDTYGAKYVAPGTHPGHHQAHLSAQQHQGRVEDLMLPEYAEANDAQYDPGMSQGSTSSKSYYAEVRNPHLLSTFQSASQLGGCGSQHGSQHSSQHSSQLGTHRTDTGSSGYGPGAAPYATTTLVCSARTTAPCSSTSTSWSQENERFPCAAYSDPDSRAGLMSGPRSPGSGGPGHYDNYNYSAHCSHPGSPSPLDHRGAALSLQAQVRGALAGSNSGAPDTGTLGRENRRLKLLRRQLNRSAHAKGLPPSGHQSSQLQLLLRSSPSSSRSGSCSTQGGGSQGASPPEDAVDEPLHQVQHHPAPMTVLRQEPCDYTSSGSSSCSRRYGSSGSSGGSGGSGGRGKGKGSKGVAYSGLPRRGGGGDP